MTVHALSDLHLHGEEQPYLFTAEKEEIFTQLVSEIHERGDSLVIAGDCIDFTGMQPPRVGHREFFDELFPRSTQNHPAIQGALRRTGLSEQLHQVRIRFPGLFKSLGKLARHRRLTMIPGNHDCVFRAAMPQGQFAHELQVDEDAIQWRPSLRVKGVAFAMHGNQFDPSNRTGSGCWSRGVAITEALYRALMPALRVYGVPKRIVDAIPAVRPEEVVILGIQDYLGERESRRLIKAFVRLIARNGYFHGLKRALMFPLVHPVPGLSAFLESYLTPRHFARAIPDESGMRMRVHEHAEKLARKLKPRVRAVVLGHTHELDHSDTYLNLGTWIDHITGISLDHLRHADTSLPVLRIGDEELSLHDARDLPQAGTIEDCRCIYSISRKQPEILRRRA